MYRSLSLQLLKVISLFPLDSVIFDINQGEKARNVDPKYYTALSMQDSNNLAVFVHGLSASSQELNQIAKEMTAQNVSTLKLLLPHHMSRNQDGTLHSADLQHLTREKLISFMTLLLQSIDSDQRFDRLVIYAISMGTLITLNSLRLSPSPKLAQLVLISPYLCPSKLIMRFSSHILYPLGQLIYLASYLKANLEYVSSTEKGESIKSHYPEKHILSIPVVAQLRDECIAHLLDTIRGLQRQAVKIQVVIHVFDHHLRFSDSTSYFQNLGIPSTDILMLSNNYENNHTFFQQPYNDLQLQEVLSAITKQNFMGTR